MEDVVEYRQPPRTVGGRPSGPGPGPLQRLAGGGVAGDSHRAPDHRRPHSGGRRAAGAAGSRGDARRRAGVPRRGQAPRRVVRGVPAHRERQRAARASGGRSFRSSRPSAAWGSPPRRSTWRRRWPATAAKSTPEKVALVGLEPAADRPLVAAGPGAEVHLGRRLQPVGAAGHEDAGRRDGRAFVGNPRAGAGRLPARAGSCRAANSAAAAIRQLFILLRRMYPLVVVDLGHALSEDQVEAMRQSNLVGLVVRADVPGLRRVHWALEALAGDGPGARPFRTGAQRLRRTRSKSSRPRSRRPWT